MSNLLFCLEGSRKIKTLRLRFLEKNTTISAEILLEDRGRERYSFLKEKKYLLAYFKSVNGGFRTLKKGSILNGKLKPIYEERQKHQQVHPSLMYGQLG